MFESWSISYISHNILEMFKWKYTVHIKIGCVSVAHSGISISTEQTFK